MNEKATVICMTPTKNEEWIIERFVQAASIWADVIIIADQLSSDRTVELASQYEKVQIITNDSLEFNEPERQKLLINEARKLPGKKLLVALDVDEFLTGNFADSQEWENMKAAEPGTVFSFRWPLIADTFLEYWYSATGYQSYAMMDDGSPHIGSKMHSVRIPMRENATVIPLEEIEVMHFQFTDWNRMLSKHRWYQCYERIQYPQKRETTIYRMYNHMYAVPKKDRRPIPKEWLDLYQNVGIDLIKSGKQDRYWWDYEIDKMLQEYGTEYFRWINLEQNDNQLLRYLRKTQRFYHGNWMVFLIRQLDKIAWVLWRR